MSPPAPDARASARWALCLRGTGPIWSQARLGGTEFAGSGPSRPASVAPSACGFCRDCRLRSEFPVAPYLSGGCSRRGRSPPRRRGAACVCGGLTTAWGCRPVGVCWGEGSTTGVLLRDGRTTFPPPGGRPVEPRQCPAYRRGFLIRSKNDVGYTCRVS